MKKLICLVIIGIVVSLSQIAGAWETEVKFSTIASGSSYYAIDLRGHNMTSGVSAMCLGIVGTPVQVGGGTSGTTLTVEGTYVVARTIADALEYAPKADLKTVIPAVDIASGDTRYPYWIDGGIAPFYVLKATSGITATVVQGILSGPGR